ncbi:MAG: 23S rRNA (uracil(1939)-C(5))-methyltransferase RlmD [Clostridia bacterium]|nr:23S rRNA (uracil(1939)-C(5))-methyltransferase RlmD [Clostridia bacterium]
MTDSARNCPYFKKCGACQTLNLTYEEELSLKMKRLISLLGRFAHVGEILSMDKPLCYRNKTQTLFRYNGGRVESGLYRSSDSGIVHVDRCLMEDPDLAPVTRTVKKLADAYKLKVWDGRRGEMRSVMVRKGFGTGEMQAAIVTKSGMFEGAAEMAAELVRRHPKIVSVSVIENATQIPLWMNGEEYGVHGPGYLEDVLAGCRFRVPAKAFYQINPIMTEVLYKTAAEFAEIKSGERVLDAYCGIGTVGIAAVKGTDARLEGFDVNEDAVRAAGENAELNGIRGARYTQKKDASFLGDGHYDVIFADPPRAGCDRRFLEALVRAAPERFVYISCDPETLARDLRLLGGTYKVKKIQPVDMFPGTGHVETVCLLSKLESQPHIEVKLNMSELDLTKAEKKATYQEIKDYVMEHTGLKVSSLYIAQVKEKCGIIERENYNKPKSPGAKQAKCPPEKEKAIREALRHFGMIPEGTS